MKKEDGVIVRRDSTRYGILSSFILSIVFLFGCIISFYNIVKMDDSIQLVANRPFIVADYIHTIREDIYSVETRMRRLLYHNKQQDINFATEAVDNFRVTTEKNFPFIAENYLGSKEEIEELHNELKKLYEEQQFIIEHALGKTTGQLEDLFTARIEPHYEKIEKMTRSILHFTKNTVNMQEEKSQSIKRSYQAIMCGVAAVFLLFLGLFQYFLTRKNKEIYHRDFLFNLLADNVEEVFCIYKLSSKKFEYVSPNIATLLGMSKKVLSERPNEIFYYMNKEDAKKLQGLVSREAIHVPIERECQIENPKTGEKKWMMLRIIPVMEKKQITRYILTMLDLSETKRTQQVLRDALTNAQAASKAKSDFLSHMSHEIRTPINVIIGMTTIAERQIDDKGKIQNCLNRIDTSSKHLLSIINDILDMSKIESGKMLLAREEFYLETVINSVSSIIYPQAEEKKQAFDIIVKGDVTERLIGDSLRLHQILLNLLTNAVKFTPEGGSVRLEIKQTGKKNKVHLRFIIADTGIGMSKEFQKKVFMPFEQEEGWGDKQSSGTGLGMAITKNIVNLMNGTIGVKSESGDGTTFTVELGFDIADKEKEELVNFHDLKVLVVDDDESICEHTVDILKHIGVDADWTVSGEKAVELVSDAHKMQKDYDVCFIDWKMSEIDGIEVTRRMRRFVGEDTPTIILSAFEWMEIEEEARRAGVNTFIAKPIFRSSVYNLLLKVKSGNLAKEEKKETEYHFEGKRILIAEDNELNMEIAVSLLEQTGADIECAVNGQEAVQKFDKSGEGYYDAILMDIQMPVMDGYEATRAIRRAMRKDAPDIPVIAMTANAFVEDVSASLDAGMNAHIVKPIDFEMLCKTLHEYM